MNFKELTEAFDKDFGEQLFAAGFERSGPGWWTRERGDELNVLQMQKHSAEALFCVNLGVHFSFLPAAGTESPLSGSLSLPDCELKIRLTARAEDKDQWWSIDSSSLASVADALFSRGLQIFASYRLSGPIASLDGQSVEEGRTGLLDSMTKVRACLLLARMYERSGNRAKCVEVATVGLKHAGMAVGPKKALKDVIARCAA